MDTYTHEELLSLDDQQLAWLVSAGRMNFADAITIQAVRANAVHGNIPDFHVRKTPDDFETAPQTSTNARERAERELHASDQDYVSAIVAKAENDGFLKG